MHLSRAPIVSEGRRELLVGILSLGLIDGILHRRFEPAAMEGIAAPRTASAAAEALLFASRPGMPAPI